MKRTSFALAVLAALSMIVSPVAPAYAAGGDAGGTPAQTSSAKPAKKAKLSAERQQIRSKIAAHAERGEAAILSKAQVDRLKVTNPKLHAKIMAAYYSNTIPELSPAEKKMLHATTQKNLAQYKAGDPGAGLLWGGSTAFGVAGWFVVGFIVFVLFLVILDWMQPGGAQRFWRSLFPAR